MSSFWRRRLELSLFGESHGEAIGITIQGLPAGFKPDWDQINKEMERRRPGNSPLATPRKEKDEIKVLSGYFDGHLTGTPLTAIIYNGDQKSRDYQRDLVRPGHADYTGAIKYHGFQDHRGGGHFSGRLTAPLVFAGALAKQVLAERGIEIGAHIYRLGPVFDRPFEEKDFNVATFATLRQQTLPTLEWDKSEAMTEAVLCAKTEKDSLGGIIEGAITGIPAGVGAPFFDSVESIMAHLLFSIPAVKGVDFGIGFRGMALFGSQFNDPFYFDEEENVRTRTNHNGGILGGITNGMPILFRVAVKPTPSIGQDQETIDMAKKETVTHAFAGRHDPSILPRAVPVVEAMAAIAILDLMEGE